MLKWIANFFDNLMVRISLHQAEEACRQGDLGGFLICMEDYYCAYLSVQRRNGNFDLEDLDTFMERVEDAVYQTGYVTKGNIIFLCTFPISGRRIIKEQKGEAVV